MADGRFGLVIPPLFATGKVVVGGRTLLFTMRLLTCRTRWQLAITLGRVSMKLRGNGIEAGTWLTLTLAARPEERTRQSWDAE